MTRRNKPIRCPACGYPLAEPATPQCVCSECGSQATWAPAPHRETLRLVGITLVGYGVAIGFAVAIVAINTVLYIRNPPLSFFESLCAEWLIWLNVPLAVIMFVLLLKLTLFMRYLLSLSARDPRARWYAGCACLLAFAVLVEVLYSLLFT